MGSDEAKEMGVEGSGAGEAMKEQDEGIRTWVGRCEDKQWL